MAKNQPLSETRLLTTADLQRRFGVCRTTIWYWRQRKALPAIHIAGNKVDALRFDAKAVKAWAQNNGMRHLVLDL